MNFLRTMFPRTQTQTRADTRTQRMRQRLTRVRRLQLSQRKIASVCQKSQSSAQKRGTNGLIWTGWKSEFWGDIIAFEIAFPLAGAISLNA